MTEEADDTLKVSSGALTDTSLYPCKRVVLLVMRRMTTYVRSSNASLCSPPFQLNQGWSRHSSVSRLEEYRSFGQTNIIVVVTATKPVAVGNRY